VISPMAFLAVFAIIVFLVGCALGALVIFVVSIHRAGSRTPIYEIGTQQRGAISRGVLMTTRTDRGEASE
jgi:hypothetical protein